MILSEELSVKVSVAKLLEIQNDNGIENPWGNWTISIDDIKSKVASGKLLDQPFDYDDFSKWTQEMHLCRCAWFAFHGIDRAIDIDVGIPAVGFVPENIISDGHHRFYGAVARGDEFIDADISGQTDYAEKLLGVKIS